MKVRVTHLKAPWPAGAVIGSIVAVPGDDMPSWAVGKCEPFDGQADADFTWEPPAAAAQEEPAKPTLPPWLAESVKATIADAVKPLQDKIAEQAEQIAALSKPPGELVVNPASAGDSAVAAGAGDAAPAAKTATKAKATG